MRLELRPKNCKGCNICVTFCPKNLLALDDLGKIRITEEAACVGCGLCELRCPDFAIRLYKEE